MIPRFSKWSSAVHCSLFIVHQSVKKMVSLFTAYGSIFLKMISQSAENKVEAI
jgi:hypothetical protein